MKQDTRVEKDSLGPFEVPAEAYYGVQTARALENFPISGHRAHPDLIRAYVCIKKACALANAESGVLEASKSKPILQACNEILAELNIDPASGNGKRPAARRRSGDTAPKGIPRFLGEFVVDVYQAGAGTSFNMNVNEVIANRAIEILGRPRGDYGTIHPNDHVNMGQSTNDTFPTATHVAALLQTKKLLPVLESLESALAAKGEEFGEVIKSARTHLQDAVPITLGQEFGAYAAAIRACALELERRSQLLRAVALGGTAAGTGTNTSRGFREKAIAHLSKITGLPLTPPADPRMALQSHQPLAAVSSALKELSLELIRIANDLRLMCSGPTTGFAEIILPAVQPGSSIMPGKVNPSIPECLNMVCFQIVGRDLGVAMAAQAGQMDLNVMTPLTAYNLLDSMQLLLKFLPQVERRCIRGIKADAEKCREYFGRSLSLAALLNPKLGYSKSAEVFKEALAKKTTVPKLVLDKGLLTERELSELLDPKAVTGTLDAARGR